MPDSRQMLQQRTGFVCRYDRVSKSTTVGL